MIGDNNNNRRQTNNNHRKLARQKSRLVFLLKCRRQNITPRFIMHRVNHLLQHYEMNHVPNKVKSQFKVLTHHIKASLLSMEISTCVTQIEGLKRKLLPTEESTLPNGYNQHIDDENNRIYSTELKMSNQHLHGKFTGLLENQEHVPDIQFDDSFIKNLSGKEVPDEVKLILSIGPKFATVPETIPYVDLASDAEAIISQELPKQSQREARGEALCTITRFSKQHKELNRIDKYLQKAARSARKYPKENRDLMISNSDKGEVTIISKKEDYYSKIRILLSDLSSFEPIDADPTKQMKGKVNRFLDKLYHASYISDEVKKRLKTWNTIPPRLFGQIKYHKPCHPIRLIVSTINTAAYKMSRFLATILRKSFKPKYNVKNSKHFIKLVRKKKISKGNVLVSYDVVNCFGNIPTDKALELIDRDFHLIEQHTPIPKKEFLKMLGICLKHANYFVFAGKFYRQNKGMFMGSSLAPILVERVIEDIVDRAIEDLGLEPDFWSTYVDDHLTSIPKQMAEILKEKLNSYDPDVQFTMVMEDESDNSIEFLDTTVYNCNEKLITKWFHKPIASNRILNYFSKHPNYMVTNVAKAFITRVLTLSHKSFHDEIVTTINSILRKNNFPEKMIKRLIHQVKSSNQRNQWKNESSYPLIHNTTTPAVSRANSIGTMDMTLSPQANSTMLNIPTQPNPTVKKARYAGITYVPQLTEKLTKQIKRHAPELGFAPRPPEKVSKLFSDMKEKLKPGQCSCVVYGIPCGGCSKWYFGETTWTVDARIEDGHKKDLKKKTINTNTTALARHTFDTKYEFDFDGKKVMKKVQSRRTLKIHEANQIILNERTAVNYKADAAHVTPLFYNLIQKSVKKKKRPSVNPPPHQITLGNVFSDST